MHVYCRFFVLGTVDSAQVKGAGRARGMEHLIARPFHGRDWIPVDLENRYVDPRKVLHTLFPGTLSPCVPGREQQGSSDAASRTYSNADA